MTSRPGPPAPTDVPAEAPQWDGEEFRGRVASALTAFLDERARELEPLGADAEQLVEAARKAVAGGKRLRAAFCYWGYRAVLGDRADEEQVVRAAASLELLHASALVHDDYMDASDLRRGRPATHRAFEQHHRDSGWGDGSAAPSVQYGAAAAILLGDLLLSWADQRLRTCGLERDRVLAALEVFDATRTEVVAGQFLDVSVQARRASDVASAMRVLRYKSAKYSVERPLHIGAALAGGGTEVRAALTEFGLPLGEAFQLRDDLLGVFGDPDLTGKPAGDDLREGKRTVLVALALEHASADDARFLDTRLGTPLDPDEVERLREVIETSGAAEQVEAMIDDLTGRCLRALDAAPVTGAARWALTALAGAATQRVV